MLLKFEFVADKHSSLFLYELSAMRLAMSDDVRDACSGVRIPGHIVRLGQALAVFPR